LQQTAQEILELLKKSKCPSNKASVLVRTLAANGTRNHGTAQKIRPTRIEPSLFPVSLLFFIKISRRLCWHVALSSYGNDSVLLAQFGKRQKQSMVHFFECCSAF